MPQVFFLLVTGGTSRLGGEEQKQSVGFQVHHVDCKARRDADRPEVRGALGLVHVFLPDEHEGPDAADAGGEEERDVGEPEHFDVRFCGGGVIPLFPRGTGAVARGLYRLILRVVPPFLGIAFRSAGIL